jgi:2-keto-4-pentenoate hydratase/2-oxohepta-3-ene-1,7-dioic acid hydratase in catechol pathway
MKIARYHYQDQVGYGVVEQGQIEAIAGELFAEWEKTGRTMALDQVELLPPVIPSKLICVGLNYASHAQESNIGKLPEEPVIFLCAPSALIGHQQTIYLSHDQQRIDYEAELAVVIGRQARHVSKDEAPEYIFGYTCANDVSNRDLQKKDGQFSRAKSYDTYKPLGPWIETECDPRNLGIRLWQNGVLKQSATTRQLLFSVNEIVSFLSAVMTLEPGDVILTGTPQGVGPLSEGDQIEIEIEGIGRLSNQVRIAK